MPDGKQSRASLLLVIRRLQRDVHVTIRIRTDDDLRRVFFLFLFLLFYITLCGPLLVPMSRNGGFGAGPPRNDAHRPPGGSPALLLAVRHGGELPGRFGLPNPKGRPVRMAPGDEASPPIHRPHRQPGHGRLQAFHSQALVGMARLSHVTTPLLFFFFFVFFFGMSAGRARPCRPNDNL